VPNGDAGIHVGFFDDSLKIILKIILECHETTSLIRECCE